MRGAAYRAREIYGTYEPEGEDNVMFIVIKVSAHRRFHQFCRLRP